MQILMERRSNSKYQNKLCIVGGIKFHSIKEGKRYVDLLLLQKAGKIFKLQLQTPFKIEINGVKICTYRADFTYYDAAGAYVVEDTKGKLTDVYKLKKKMVLAIHSITILET